MGSLQMAPSVNQEACDGHLIEVVLSNDAQIEKSPNRV